ncbi:hypothetical protein OESDEN_22156 [Oesophagostomum dentatum]|uniref:Uncharacterized protein n=1 Tax=Oesophagostomum dentatum TaxID=61180 RepID=A0A0B1RZW9_OESDE|nr:hypothetical protein OESDEN_22156 [Oesophagostomum dentatum]
MDSRWSNPLYNPYGLNINFLKGLVARKPHQVTKTFTLCFLYAIPSRTRS